MEAAERARDKVQEAYTAQRQTRSASKPLQMGQRVWLQDQQTKKWTIGGVIKSVRNGGRSYVVEQDSCHASGKEGEEEEEGQLQEGSALCLKMIQMHQE